MNETRRQAYLEAMAIQTYFPRRQLLGAKPSPLYDFPVEAGSAYPESSAKLNKDFVKQGLAADGLDAIEALRSNTTSQGTAAVTPNGKSESTEEQEQNAAAIPAVDSAPSLSFTLRYYRINENLAVLDETPPQASRQLNERSAVLMQGILKALGQGGANENLEAEEFSWPMRSGYPMKDTPQAEAAKAISGFLQMRQETDGFSNLLVFAGQLEDILLQSAAENRARDFESSKGYYVTVTHSLASMLALPSLKRDVWEQLQAIRQRIS